MLCNIDCSFLSYFKNKGFTLIEMMVVIIIMGIILSFITLSFGDGGQTQRLRQEAQRLASLLTLASQEAILQAKELGISFTSNGYHFYEWHGQQWSVLNDDDLFYARTLPPKIQLEFRLAGESPRSSEEDAQDTPQLLLLSSGEISPFEVVLTTESVARLHYRLTSSVTGIITVQCIEF